MKAGKMIKIFQKVGYYEGREDYQPKSFFDPKTIQVEETLGLKVLDPKEFWVDNLPGLQNNQPFGRF